MADPHRAFHQLQRMLNIDDQCRSHRPPPVIREEDCEVISEIVYDTKTEKIEVREPSVVVPQGIDPEDLRDKWRRESQDLIDESQRDGTPLTAEDYGVIINARDDDF